MKVIRAEVMGMCFGVRDALEVIDAIEEPGAVTIHGQLVHNEAVLDRLEARGFAMADEADRRALPATPVVLITAHGVSDRERARLAEAGKRLVDTTCPLVTRVHQAARTLQEQGYHVLVIGRRGHVEVRGIVEDLDGFDVVETVAEVAPVSPSAAGDRLPDDGDRAPGRARSARRSPRGIPAPRSGSSTRSACRPRSISGRSTGCSARSTRWSSSAAGTRTTRASWSRSAASAGCRRSTSRGRPTSTRRGSRGSRRSG